MIFYPKHELFVYDSSGLRQYEKKIFSFFIYLKFIYSEKATKGPAAKNDTTENPGCFNQILSFESRKWSPVATF
jgi:hypothetical protein